MDDTRWIKERICEIRARLNRIDNLFRIFKYDDETTERLSNENESLAKEVLILEHHIPERKLQDYNGQFRCLRCGCVVNQYAKYCHYCGQRFALKQE